MLFKKSVKLNKKMLARLRMRRFQMILLAIATHKKNTRLIKITAPHLKHAKGKGRFKRGLRKLKKFVLPNRKRAKDKWDGK